MKPDTTTEIGLLDAVFSPRSIALIGASADASKNNARPQRFLRKHGYGGILYPVNPGRDEIFGERAYPDVGSIPGSVDHAFIMVPAPSVPEVVAQCCERRIPVATIFSAGFAELGAEGLARQRDMVARARAGGLRLLGPNCMGVVNVHGKVPLTVNAVIDQEPLNAGPISVISQSGSMLGSLLSRAQPRGLGFAKLVSVGNECDLGVGELADLLVDDSDTGVVLLFLETFRDADRLALAARRAYAAGKPMIAYKLGRSAVGQRVAQTHTGALTGPDEVAGAFFRAHGIVRVDTFEGLFECAELVTGHKPPRGRRVAVLTGTGGAAAMVVDRLGVHGADVVSPPSQVIAGLAAQGISINDAPLTDIPMGGSTRGRYAAVLSALLGSEHCDAVVAVVGSSSQTDPKVIVERILEAKQRDAKPLAVFLAPRADAGLRLLQQHGVASFRTPESCADAVNAYLSWRAPSAQPVGSAADLAGLDAAIAKAPAGRLNELDAAALFGALGVPVVSSLVVQHGNECPAVSTPSAVKILSLDIPHKTDAGLVRLDVAPAELGSTVADLLAAARAQHPTARIEGVLVQPMQRGLSEVILGFRDDPEVGPVMLLGMGGVAAELRRSFSVRIAPVDLTTAQDMIAEVPELALIRGFRNLPEGDCRALADAIVRFSRLALASGRLVREAEINPLIVRAAGAGVVAVDGLVVLGGQQ